MLHLSVSSSLRLSASAPPPLVCSGGGAAAPQLQRHHLAQHQAVISSQVIQEFLNICLLKFPRHVSLFDAQQIAEEVLWPICRVMPSPGLYHRAMALHQRLGFSFYDSLIVAGALQAGCTTLYSEDLQHGQQIERLTLINPFLPEPPPAAPRKRRRA